MLGYDYIIIEQADKGSAVLVIDKEAWLWKALQRQRDDSEVYKPLGKDQTKDMIKEINEKVRSQRKWHHSDEKKIENCKILLCSALYFT